MKRRLIACARCGRHVKAGEAACPFCGGEAPVAQPQRRVVGRLSRAAMHAAGAAGAVVALADCSSGSSPRAVAFYGAACLDDGGCGAIVDSGGGDGGATVDAQDGSTAVFYGAPCLDASCVVPEAGGDAPSPDAGADGGPSDGGAEGSD